MWNRSLRVSADPGALKRHRGFETFPKHEIQHICMHARDLDLANLCHLVFLGSPVAIHSSRTASFKPTQSASPNESINPDISMKHYRFSTYSVCWVWACCVPWLSFLLMPVWYSSLKQVLRAMRNGSLRVSAHP